MARAYYNEIDPYAARWLENLIAAGHIAPGDVDTRSIEDVTPGDLAGYTQCHFFAGIGVWSYALRLAGWPDSRPVWTGSCPCQPFSAAGKGGGFADERHLWPAWYHLIGECRPRVVFGEQVASKDGLAWLDLVHADLEAAGYACGAVDLCAAGAGAPIGRQRLYLVAQPSGAGLEGHAGDGDNGSEPGRQHARTNRPASTAGTAGPGSARVAAVSVLRGVAVLDPPGARSRLSMPADRGLDDGPVWSRFDTVPCRDGWRIAEPGTFPLAHGAPARVGRLRAYGNAIVAPCAAEFIRAYLGS